MKIWWLTTNLEKVTKYSEPSYKLQLAVEQKKNKEGALYPETQIEEYTMEASFMHEVK